MSNPGERAAAASPLLLVSTYRRAAAPVIWTWGPEPDGDQLHVAMLFISAQLDDRAYHLYDPDDPARTLRASVRLPMERVDMTRDACVLHTSLTLEAST